MKQVTIKHLTTIANSIEAGELNLGVARKIAATILGLPMEAICFYGPWHHNAKRKDMRVCNLRQEWQEAGYEFSQESLLLEQ
jgi:hypothetical protein